MHPQKCSPPQGLKISKITKIIIIKKKTAKISKHMIVNHSWIS